MITAEGPPLSRATALVDVIEALPRELRLRGHEIGIVQPFHREIRENPPANLRDTGVTVDIRVGGGTFVAEFLESRTASGVQIFFVRNDAFFDRAGLYGEKGESYEDNASRFIFFNKAALELVRRLSPSPQILHAHDWAAALIPVFVRANRLPFQTVLTIHHLEEQGSFWGLDFALTNLPERFFTLRGVEYFGRLNFLKGGILHADAITTVSERFKQEMQTPAGGHGLDPVLRENAHRLISILPGADYRRWDPATDDLIPHRYDSSSIEGKAGNRAALLQEFGLAPDPSGPVFGMVTRTVEEKGFDLLMPLLDRLLPDDVRLIILGEGDPRFETALALAARKFPHKFAYRRHYEEGVAHLIEAGMDASLIPSRLDPAGLSAMYSLKYGALPVAHAAGGIQEIIEDYDPTAETGYGFLYFPHEVEALWDGIKRARALYAEPARWQKLVLRAMERDFSWETAAEKYEALYTGLLPENVRLSA